MTSVEEKSPNKKCLHCSELHYIYQCKLFRSLDYQKRCELVRKYSLYKICHFAAKCTSSLKCKRRNCGSLWHNTILHPSEATKYRSRNYHGNNGGLNCNQPAATVSVAKSFANACTSIINSRKRGAYLNIVPVKVSKGDAVIRTYALLDSGSDRTFCERHLVEKLGATLKRSSVTLTV